MCHLSVFSTKLEYIRFFYTTPNLENEVNYQDPRHTLNNALISWAMCIVEPYFQEGYLTDTDENITGTDEQAA